MAFKAVLDACVLYKMGVRDTLLSVAHVGLFRPLWSERILGEVRATWAENLPHLTEEQWAHLVGAMNDAFPDALVVGHEKLAETLEIEARDRHVLAAAIVGKADAVVTENERDFPGDYCAVFGVEVIHHDTFLEQRFDLDPELALQALEGQAARMRGKPSVDELLRRLAPTLPRFVRAVQECRAG